MNIVRWPEDVPRWEEWNNAVTGIYVNTDGDRTQISSDSYTIDAESGRYTIPFEEVPDHAVSIEIKAAGYETVQFGVPY